MSFKVVLDPQAMRDLKDIRVYNRREILNVMERILSVTPTRISRSRIKRLRGIDSPQYRLRIGEFRVFYDVEESDVYVMRVLQKSVVEQYLREMGYGPQDD